jgi:ribosomal protein S18 acetylase RimI-like enzyme
VCSRDDFEATVQTAHWVLVPVSDVGGDSRPGCGQEHFDPLVMAGEPVLGDQPLMHTVPLMVRSARSHASTTAMNGVMSSGWVPARGGPVGGTEVASSGEHAAVKEFNQYAGAARASLHSRIGSRTVEVPATVQAPEPVMEQTLNLKLLDPDAWLELRTARLQALLDSPHAFTSAYSHESEWAASEWRRLFDAATWIVACDAEKVIGLARSVSEPKRSATRHLESIWVSPTHRRRGVFSALLQALAEIERGMGVTNLLLWVLEDNHIAQRAYEALGFKHTGERQLLPAFGRFERRLRLVLGRIADAEPNGRLVGIHRMATELGQRPGVQLQEIHSLPGGAHIIDTV